MTTPFRNKRLSNGWTLEDLAALVRTQGLKVSDSQLSRLERDRGGPNPPLRAVLCRLLDLPITYFDKAERDKRQQEQEVAS